MFDKILLAVGGENPSWEHVHVAGRLAGLLDAHLTVLSVRPVTPRDLGEPYYSHTLTSRLEMTDTLLDRVREVAETAGARGINTESVEGPPAARIVEFARHGGYKLIVMGTRGRGRLQTALLGSVSAAVAAHSSVPVMIVPERGTGVNDSGMGI